MKPIYLSLITLILLLIVSACTSLSDSFDPIDENGVILPAPSDSAVYKQGQQIFETTCASCHGINGEGQFPDAPLKQDETGRYGAPPHNDEGHTWHHDDDLILQIMNEGGMGTPTQFYPMPTFAEALSTDEKIAVVSYIKTMWNEENLATQYGMTESVRAESQD
jgi:mono/diheme cytochrome c family protein